MFAKLLLKDGEQWNRPDSRLRLRSLPVTVLIELPTDAYLAFVEVDVFPAQRKRRRYAKPRSRESRNDRSVARSCTGAQATDLLVTQPAWLPSSDLPGLLNPRESGALASPSSSRVLDPAFRCFAKIVPMCSARTSWIRSFPTVGAMCFSHR